MKVCSNFIISISCLIEFERGDLLTFRLKISTVYLAQSEHGASIVYLHGHPDVHASPAPLFLSFIMDAVELKEFDERVRIGLVGIVKGFEGDFCRASTADCFDTLI